MPTSAGYRTALGALVLLAAVLRFWALDAGLPHLLTRPDEEVVLARTMLPARGELDLRWQTYPHAYVYLAWLWGEAGLRAGQLAGVLPAGSYGDVMRAAPDRLLLVQRTLSAAAGTAAVPLLVAVARPALGPGAALAAGLLLAVNLLHVRDSHAFKPDALLALAMLAGVAAMVPLARRATGVRAAGAGLAVGLAVAVKYPAVVLLPVAYVAACLGSAARGWRRLVSVPGLVAGAVAAAVFAATSPYLVTSPEALASIAGLVGALFPHAASAVAPPPLPDVPGYPDYATQPWWFGLVHHWTFSLRYGCGLPGALAAPPALVWALAGRQPLLPLAALTALLSYAAAGLSPVAHTRYMTPIVPLLALVEAGAAAALVRRLLPRHAGAGLALATLVLAAPPLAASVAYDRIAAREDTRVQAARWMAEHLPAGATVEILGSQVWFWGEPQLPAGARQVRVAPDPAALAAAGVGWVVTHDHALFSSHLDPDVMRALAPHLRLLADFDPFVDGGTGAVFDPPDAYYVPIHGFSAVRRPGPHVRVYAFVTTARRAAPAPGSAAAEPPRDAPRTSRRPPP
jgi:4-amino-4-deoxy-L-arabinose transferase-like glycosyltransferase